MILDPVFLEADPNKIVASIQEALLWFFWPRMLQSTEACRQLAFEVELDGLKLSMPKPENFPPLNVFAEAMNAIRSAAQDCQTVRCERPKKDLGQICVRKAVHSTRSWLTAPSESLIPERSAHIAVMRPVELVVRYFYGDPLPDPAVEWAGVFLSSSENDVEAAFAAAEPPAHDDWQPSLMPKGPHRTYVNVALQRIREASRSVAGPLLITPPDGHSGPSLARTSRTLGGMLGAIAVVDHAPTKSRKKRSLSIVAKPKFVRLELREGGPAAIFSVPVKASEKRSSRTVLRARAGVVIDGTIVADGGETSSWRPQVQDWRRVGGEQIGQGEDCEIEDITGNLEIAVTIPGDIAVGLEVDVIAKDNN
jgi:hypothetical protein